MGIPVAGQPAGGGVAERDVVEQEYQKGEGWIALMVVLACDAGLCVVDGQFNAFIDKLGPIDYG